MNTDGSHHHFQLTFKANRTIENMTNPHSRVNTGCNKYTGRVIIVLFCDQL